MASGVAGAGATGEGAGTEPLAASARPPARGSWREAGTRISTQLRGEWWLAVSLVLVLLGIWLRTRRMFGDPLSLWGDEALSATELMGFRPDQPSVRPLAFMLTSSFICRLLGPTELSLRLLPWLCGVSTAMLSIPLARRLLTQPGIRVLLVAIIALHPYAIDYSREFKPYAVSLFFHLTCLYCAASYWETGLSRWLAATASVAFIGVLFAQDVMFAYPGLYLALGLTAWRSRSKRQLLLVALGAALTLALLLALYWFHWRHMGGPHMAGKKRIFGYVPVWWSARYDLFYGAQDESRLGWYARKYLEIVSVPGVRWRLWAEQQHATSAVVALLSSVDKVVWTLLHVLGLAVIAWRRRFRDLLLLVPPLLVLTAFNLLQRWPYGQFRTNLFTLSYISVLACLALDFPMSRFRQLVPAGLLVFAPFLLLERDYHRLKLAIPNTEFIPSMQALIRLQGERPARPELLVVDGPSCQVHRYYKETHPGHREFMAELGARFQVTCVRSYAEAPLRRAEQLIRRKRGRFWLLSVRAPSLAELTSSVPAHLTLFAHEKLEPDVWLVAGLQRKE